MDIASRMTAEEEKEDEKAYKERYARYLDDFTKWRHGMIDYTEHCIDQLADFLEVDKVVLTVEQVSYYGWGCIALLLVLLLLVLHIRLYDD